MRSTLPAKILLATDGSEDATLAARAAVILSGRIGSEPYVVQAWHSVLLAHFEAFLRSQLEQEGREEFEDQVERIKARRTDEGRAKIAGR